MRIVYRSPLGNATYALGAVGGCVLVGLIFGEGDGSEGPKLEWLGGAALAAIAAVLVVRALRRAVVVDDETITSRDMLTTTSVPWTAVEHISFVGADQCRIDWAQGTPVTIVAHARRRQPSLAETYAGVRRDWTGERRSTRGYPSGGRLLTFAFIGSMAVVFLGALVWDDARYDERIYAARRLRDREGTAVISDVRVEEQDHGEDNPTYRTFVKARLRLPDERTVVIEVHRPGDVADHYRDEAFLPVVYDAAHPRDADFGDRPTRDAEDDSAALRNVTGPVILVGGLAGLLVFGAWIARDWKRRRSAATRRSAPMLR